MTIENRLLLTKQLQQLQPCYVEGEKEQNLVKHVKELNFYYEEDNVDKSNRGESSKDRPCPACYHLDPVTWKKIRIIQLANRR